MKILVLLSLLILPNNDLTKIARANKEKANAQSAYEKGDYEKAIKSYHILLDSMGINEAGIVLNLAHCYFRTGNMEKAAQYYQMASTSEQTNIKTTAHHQLGVIQANKQQYESALAHFKQVLKENPKNEDARKNYEIVKRLLEEQKKKEENKKEDKNEDKQQQNQQQQQQEKNQQQQQQNQQQQKENKNQENNEKGKKDQNNNQESQKSDKQQNEANPQQNDEQQNAAQKKEEQRRQQEQLKQQRLQEMNMTKEQAQMLLEALKAQELQYYQQLQRKSNKPDNGKPDW